MKKIFYFLSFLFFIQCVPTKEAFQFTNVDLLLENGSKINGKVYYPIYINQEKVTIENPKTQKIEVNQIKEIRFNMPDGVETFKKFPLKDYDFVNQKIANHFLSVISEGEINLYFGGNMGIVYKKGKKKKHYQKTNLLFANKKGEKEIKLIYADTKDATEKAKIIQDLQLFLAPYNKTINQEITTIEIKEIFQQINKN